MEELTALRTHIQQKNYQAALLLVDELEEMSREDKLSKIYSYVVILLVHLIKQQAELRTTTSWIYPFETPYGLLCGLTNAERQEGTMSPQRSLRKLPKKLLRKPWTMFV